MKLRILALALGLAFPGCGAAGIAADSIYFQLAFALDRVKAMAAEHPKCNDKEPFASLLKGDLKSTLAGGEHAIAETSLT